MCTTSTLKTRWNKLTDWVLSTFDKVQAQAFKLPFVRVDRVGYLTKTLRYYCTDEQLEQSINTSPLNVLGKEAIHKIAKHCIWKHALFTSLLSAIAVVPSNVYAQWTLLALDLIQFQLVVYIVAQKLLFLYGHKMRESESVASKAALIITTVSAVMIGTHRISQTMKSAVGATARRAVLQITARAGNRLIAVKFIQQSLKWFGIEVTKNTLILSLEFFVNVICISISGLVSFWLIYPMCNRLVKHLEEDAENGEEEVFEDIKTDEKTA